MFCPAGRHAGPNAGAPALLLPGQHRAGGHVRRRQRRQGGAVPRVCRKHDASEWVRVERGQEAREAECREWSGSARHSARSRCGNTLPAPITRLCRPASSSTTRLVQVRGRGELPLGWQRDGLGRLHNSAACPASGLSRAARLTRLRPLASPCLPAPPAGLGAERITFDLDSGEIFVTDSRYWQRPEVRTRAPTWWHSCSRGPRGKLLHASLPQGRVPASLHTIMVATHAPTFPRVTGDPACLAPYPSLPTHSLQRISGPSCAPRSACR